MEIPAIKHKSDIRGITALIERIRSIKILFDHYGLDVGYEVKIFKVF